MTCNDCIHRSVCYRADFVQSDHARKCGDFDALQRRAEKICDLEKSNFDVRQYKLDADTAYECGYNAGLQAQTDGEYVRKKDVMGCIGQTSLHFELARKLRKLSPVTIPQTDCNTCDKAVRNRVGVIGCAKFDSKPTVAIPSATGHWIAIENEEMETIGYYCSKCDLPMETEEQTDYCPNCGCRMVEPQERK